VIVAFHFENHSLPVANINNTGILTGAANHLWPFGGQGAEPFFRGFIGAMLIPHGREDAHFRKARVPAYDFENAIVLVWAQPMGGNKVGRYHWILQVVIPYGANLHPDTKVNGQREGWNSY
jgi:hypothetical protein